MNITVNGQTESVPGAKTIQSFLESKGLKVDQVIVAVNDDVIEVGNYAATNLNDGDTVDLMSFVGGG